MQGEGYLKRLSILGSTGSIGRSTLEVVRSYPSLFDVVALTACSNIDLIEEQVREFSPRLVVLGSKDNAMELRQRLSGNVAEVLWGVDGLIAASTYDEVDLVISAISGAAGLIPNIEALRAGKDIAIANKESLVIAGDILKEEAEKMGCRLMPVDSEHSAVFQSLIGHRREDVRRIILTASGGPFLKLSDDELDRVTPEEALNHPNWVMGKKITIDSATMMNKGLEVIEARWLFDIEPDIISICIHPESIVHSMVEYRDGSVIAQMAYPDMRIPIAYALTYPERLALDVPAIDLTQLGSLTFFEPDVERFPCIRLAYRALELGGSMPAVLNAADEVAVEAFLQGRITFTSIPRVIEGTMDMHEPSYDLSIERLLDIDRWARQEALHQVGMLGV